MTVIAIILAGSAPLQFSSPRDLVVNMRQPHFARVRARRNWATNAGRELIILIPGKNGLVIHTSQSETLGGYMRANTFKLRRTITDCVGLHEAVVVSAPGPSADHLQYLGLGMRYEAGICTIVISTNGAFT